MPIYVNILYRSIAQLIVSMCLCTLIWILERKACSSARCIDPEQLPPGAALAQITTQGAAPLPSLIRGKECRRPTMYPCAFNGWLPPIHRYYTVRKRTGEYTVDIQRLNTCICYVSTSTRVWATWGGLSKATFTHWPSNCQRCKNSKFRKWVRVIWIHERFLDNFHRYKSPICSSCMR